MLVRSGCEALKVAGIVLAAGSSRRLGEPKQLVFLGGETLLERAARVAREAGLDPVYIVFGVAVSGGHGVDFGVGKMGSCTPLLNEGAAEGMASSIRVGVEAAAEAGVDGVVVMACDQPAVTAGHLWELMAGGGEVVASEYAGRRGVPAYFPASAFAALMELRGDVGARELLRGARGVELPGGELDVDTPEELARARELFG
jgi:molybdenum cofactor cytidylyltransferase